MTIVVAAFAAAAFTAPASAGPPDRPLVACEVWANTPDFVLGQYVRGQGGVDCGSSTSLVLNVCLQSYDPNTGTWNDVGCVRQPPFGTANGSSTSTSVLLLCSSYPVAFDYRTHAEAWWGTSGHGITISGTSSFYCYP